MYRELKSKNLLKKKIRKAGALRWLNLKVFSAIFSFILLFSYISPPFVYAATFTPNMAKRSAPGPFSAAPIVQGKTEGTGGDQITFTPGPEISNKFYQNIDSNQGSVVFWVTPEWNGNDGIRHDFFDDYGTGQLRIYKGTDGKLNMSYNNGTASTDISSWTSGNTYLVVGRWDIDNTLDGTNHLSISVDDSHNFGLNFEKNVFGLAALSVGTSYGNWTANAIIEGLTIYRRPLFDGTYGVDVGNGDEIAQIYNSGAGKDPTLITGSWDVVFALPTNSSVGTLSSGTGEAWSHPHSSNVLYTDTNNTGGFMMDGTYTDDGWEATGALSPTNGVGDSLSFDGDNDYVLNTSLDTSTFDEATLMGWVNFEGLNNINNIDEYHFLFGKSADFYILFRSYTSAPGAGYFLWARGSTENNTQDLSEVYPLPSKLRGWHHVGQVYTGSALQIFLDGNKVVEQTGVDTDGLNDLTNNFVVGSHLTLGYYYDSNIKDVRFFSRALSEQEIKDTIYKDTLLSTEQEGLELWWKMDEGSGQTVSDSSAEGNDGTLGADAGSDTDDPSWSTDAPFPTVSALTTAEKIFAGGYKYTSSGANQGIYYPVTGQTAGQNYVVRALAHSDGTSIPKVIIWDTTNDAEITYLTGTDTSTRTDPDVLLFTFELPTVARNGVAANSTDFEVRLINTKDSGTTYWHQVEVLENLIDNPSLETGSGDPWIPDGWYSSGLDTGDSEQEVFTIRSGSSSIEINPDALNEAVSTYLTTNPESSKFISAGGGFYGVSSGGGRLEFIPHNYTLFQYSLSEKILVAPQSAEWSHLGAVYRKTANNASIWNVSALSAFVTDDRFADDIYAFELDDISLTVTPASLANSTESTGVRVDGADKYIETSSAWSDANGYISFEFTPRHNSADMRKFLSSQDPQLFNFNRDNSNYVNLLAISDNIFRLRARIGGVDTDETWNHTGELIAGTTYDMRVSYDASDVKVFVDDVEKVGVSPAGGIDWSGNAPNTFNFGSDGGTQVIDATFNNIIIDGDAPAITLTPLSPDPTTNKTPSLTGTATESQGTVESVEFQMDSTAGSWTACTADDGTFDEATEAFTCSVTSDLTNGSHTMYVRATDSHGIFTPDGSETTDTFVVNFGTPTLTLNPITPNPTTGSTATITGTATDNGGTISNVEFQLDSAADSWSSCTADDGTFDQASETFSCTTSTLTANKGYTVYVRATDDAPSFSTNAQTTFIRDTLPPEEFNLTDPDSKSYTNNARPVFKWNKAFDSTTSISLYTLSIDNGDEGDFVIENIPHRNSGNIETSKYKVKYNEATMELTTRSSDDWIDSENDGKLREAKVKWSVSAIDEADNKRTISRTLYVDKTSPEVEIDNVNGVQLPQDDRPFEVRTTDTTPKIAGSTNDPQVGDKDQRFSSDAKRVDLKILKEDSFGVFKDNIEAKINLDGLDSFNYTLSDALDYGTYKIEATPIDEAGNVGDTVEFNMVITQEISASTVDDALETGETSQDTDTETEQDPTQQETSQESETDEDQKDSDEEETTIIAEPVTVVTEPTKPSIFKRMSTSLAQTANNISNATRQTLASALAGVGRATNATISFTGDFIAYNVAFVGRATTSTINLTEQIAVNTYGRFVSSRESVENSFNQIALNIQTSYINAANSVNITIHKTADNIGVAIVKLGYSIINEPTQIYDVSVELLSATEARISWKTNHTANAKINYGLDTTYTQTVQTDELNTYHEFTLTDLEPNTQYHFEVMSQGATYVYDANRTFTTPQSIK